jgi:hypothetical protein
MRARRMQHRSPCAGAGQRQQQAGRGSLLPCYRRLHAVPTYCTIICRSLNNAKTATINECRAYLHVSKVKSKFIEKIQQKI